MSKIVRMDHTPMVIKALAIKRNIHKDIDAIYSVNKHKYHTIAKKSEWYNTRYFRENDIETELYCKKILGIFICAKDDEFLTMQFLKIIKKAYPKEFNVVMNCEKEEFSPNYYKKFIHMNQKNTVIEVTSSMCIAFFLASSRGLKLTFKTEEEIKVGESLYCAMNLYKKDFITTKGKHEDVVKEIRSKLKYNSILTFQDCDIKNKFYTYIDTVTSFDVMPITSLQHIQMTYQDMNDIIRSYIQSFGVDTIEKIDMEDAKIKIFIAIAFRSFAKEYNNAKKIILNKSSELDSLKETREISLENENLKNKILELNQKNQEIRCINDKKQEALNESQLQIDRLKKRIYELETETKKEKNKNLILEEILSRDYDNNSSKEVDFTTALNTNVLVFGGPDKWQSKIMELSETYKCVSIDKYNFSLDIIDNAAIILINYGYLSHGQYYKVIDYARNKNKKIVYCTNNIEKTLIKINDILNGD